ncbi:MULTISPECIES: hypothetical protein [unclassified Cellulophaga]|uniref:hypothetical protein n=1 Tax=unclassified Cellulophaga TaxID=2634405 RepID=UPI0026E45047|nr:MULTISPECIES: hypothetical protein [unclassified Cellulophaga]MDO6490438.1 hypothetical protein [Cellulophaga sp. 2_MG-2023]MDO6494368.1 hypothetical protein [Cellulophaga sp. 3_MG-2023]
MKTKLFVSVLATAALFLSCSNDKKTTEQGLANTQIKSDIIIENTKIRTGISAADEERSFIIVTGKSLLNGTATVKTTNLKGEEIHCESFPAKQLIDQEYKTANSTLKESHIMENVQNYFEVNHSNDLAKS